MPDGASDANDKPEGLAVCTEPEVGLLSNGQGRVPALPGEDPVTAIFNLS